MIMSQMSQNTSAWSNRRRTNTFDGLENDSRVSVWDKIVQAFTIECAQSKVVIDCSNASVALTKS